MYDPKRSQRELMLRTAHANFAIVALAAFCSRIRVTLMVNCSGSSVGVGDKDERVSSRAADHAGKRLSSNCAVKVGNLVLMPVWL